MKSTTIRRFTTSDDATITLTAPATPDGVVKLEAAVARIKAGFGHNPAPPASVSSEAAPSNHEHDAVKLYKKTNTRSREVLGKLPGSKEQALTPTEIAAIMAPDKNGKQLSKGSVRAAIRVVQGFNGRLTQKGILSPDQVVKIDWDKYDAEGSG